MKKSDNFVPITSLPSVPNGDRVPASRALIMIGRMPAKSASAARRRARMREASWRVVLEWSLRGMPHNWLPEELDELGPGLRAFIEAPISARSGTHALCARCGAQFRLPRGPRSRWCGTCRPVERERSERERLRRRAKIPAPGLRVCEACGYSYRASRSWSKYCSGACAQRAYRGRLTHP
jgi:hypothetical protein